MATSKTRTVGREKPGPWKTWTMKILNYEKLGKQLDPAKILEDYGIVY